MGPSPLRDFIVGLFVVAGIAAIAYLSVTVGGFSWGNRDERVLYARFHEIGGLKTRAQVVIGGVPVGEVVAIELDPEYRARVTMKVDAAIDLPTDSSAAVRTAGLLGDQFVALEPGGEETLLDDGGEIAFTEDAVVLERMIGKLVQNLGVSE